MKRRHWTADEKLKILLEAEKEGITATIRKHGIYSNTFYQWKEKYDTCGKDALASKHYKIDPEVKRLQRENQQLKEMLAERELALRIKEELLKKSTARKGTGS
ncbi:transposase [Cesiribacter sp. SM1]|uniref:transposase n=1 Tax=Cesiribacter sp. SM1 TaxID=2861196 RepID=UPI001CD6AE82|nr:transposase [Cesiribacter sp. SM1]